MLKAGIRRASRRAGSDGIWLSVPRRGFSGQTINEPISPDPQPTTTSEDGTQRLRLRSHGGRSLPLPPVMDSVAVEAKDRYTKAKPWKHEECQKSSFTAQMEMNAFAQALASPIRQCQLTNARLPSHFLLPIVGSVEVTQDDAAEVKQRASLTTAILDQDENTKRSPTRSYVLAKHTALNLVTQRKKWPLILQERVRKWLEARTGRSLQHARDAQKHIGWDANMADMVRSKLQQDVIKYLRLGIYHNYVADAEEMSHLTAEQAAQEVACLLMVTEIAESRPQSLQQASIPVYALHELLGTPPVGIGNTTMSRDSSKKVADVALLVVRQEQRAVKLQTALMKLQSYLEA